MRVGEMATKPDNRLCDIFCRHTSDLEQYLARQLGSPDEAADVAQEIYLRLVQLDDVERLEQPRAYLFQTAANMLRDRGRRRRTRHADSHVPIYDLELEAPIAPADDVVASKQSISLFESAMYRLPERQRQAFLMHRFGERTQAEIAQELGISVSFVEKLIRQAGVNLKAALCEARPQAA